MRKHPSGYGLIILLIVMAIVAWLTARSYQRSRASSNAHVEEALEEQGIRLPAGQAVTPESAAKAVESKVNEYEEKNLQRKEQAIDGGDR